MNTTRTITAALGLSFGLIGWAGCGGGAETAKDSATSEIAEASQPTATPREAAPEPTMCDLMSATEVTAALGGKLPLGSPDGTETGCSYPVLFGVDGNALSYGTISRGNYDAYKGYEDQSSVDFEYIEGLGQEAFVINNAQVCVLLSEDKALFVGAQVMAFQEELPITQEELEAGLIAIASKVAAKI